MFSFFSKDKTENPKKSILKKIDKESLEELLLGADMSYELVEKILDKFSSSVKITDLQTSLLSILNQAHNDNSEIQKPFVQIVIGVNGAGKTTTIAKLTHKYLSSSKSVLLGAGDTFRAAAVEQLSIWADKLGVDIVRAEQGSDPSAVAYNTLQSAVAKKVDYVIIDTAGRLQNQVNLLSELKKIIRVSKKIDESFPHRKILIIDGMQANMAIEQSRVFHNDIGVDGIIITKLDGTSRGGAIFSIVDELKIPILYIGTGERQEDLQEFVPQEFVQSLIDYISEEFSGQS